MEEERICEMWGEWEKCLKFMPKSRTDKAKAVQVN